MQQRLASRHDCDSVAPPRNQISTHPNTLQIISRIFGTYGQYGYPLNKEKLSLFANAVIIKNSPFENDSEVAWALWMIKENILVIEKAAIESVQLMGSSICNLILVDLMQSRSITITKNYKIYENEESLVGQNWLLSYELGVKKWVGFDGAHIDNHEWMRILRDERVSFYNENAKTKPIFNLKIMKVI